MASFRITLYHEGADFSVLDRELVDMAVLGGEPPDMSFDRLVGTWAELRDSYGKVMFRRLVDDPLRGGVETFAPPGSDEPPVRRVTVEVPSGHLVVTTPALAGADAVVVVRAVPSGDGKTRDVSELVVVDVADLAAQAGDLPSFEDPTKGGV